MRSLKKGEKPSSNRKRICLSQDEVATSENVSARSALVESVGANVKDASAVVME